MVNALRLVVLAVLVVAATATVSAAQSVPEPDNAAVTLAVGYQFQRIDETNMAKGAFVDLSFGRRDIEGVLQFGASSKTSTFTSRHAPPGFSQTTDATMHLSRAMAGVRLHKRGDTATMFIHALGGVMRAGSDGTSTTTGPSGTETSTFDLSSSEGAVQVGVGLDIKLSTLIRLRLGADYIRVLADTEDHVWLATAGLSFGLGKR